MDSNMARVTASQEDFSGRGFAFSMQRSEMKWTDKSNSDEVSRFVIRTALQPVIIETVKVNSNLS